MFSIFCGGLGPNWASQMTIFGHFMPKTRFWRYIGLYLDEIITDKEDILEQWALFYEKLYKDEHQPSDSNSMNLSEIPPILYEETEKKINQLKSGKSPGIDHINAEFLQAGGDIAAEVLTKLFNIIISTGQIPDNFKEAVIIVLYKKGDPRKCSNYRPISLLSHIYKLFISIITDRIKGDLYFCLPPSQAAYQPGRGAIVLHKLYVLSRIH